MEQLEPGYPERQDYQAALIASVIANSQRNPKKGKAFTVGDFLLKWEEPKPKKQKQSVLLGSLQFLASLMTQKYKPKEPPPLEKQKGKK